MLRLWFKHLTVGCGRKEKHTIVRNLPGANKTSVRRTGLWPSVVQQSDRNGVE
jgi:hypothetical protein